MDAKNAQVGNIVDCNLDPYTPYEPSKGEFDDGSAWSVAQHRQHGKLELVRRSDNLTANGRRIGLFLAGTPDALKGWSDLNANVLDYLIAHQDLIPDSWRRDEKGNARRIFFRGTIYKRYPENDHPIACLCLSGGWKKSHYCGTLEGIFGSTDYVAMMQN